MIATVTVTVVDVLSGSWVSPTLLRHPFLIFCLLPLDQFMQVLG